VDLRLGHSYRPKRVTRLALSTSDPRQLLQAST